jgi:hypothetical protein
LSLDEPLNKDGKMMEDYTYSISDFNLLAAAVFQLKSTLGEFNPTRIPYI